MRLICKYCGKEYDAPHGSTACPDCVAERKTKVIRPRTCCQCGAVFPGNPSSRYCPDCRAERKAEAKRRYDRQGFQRHLGSIDKCVVCGGDYVVTAGTQKYCPQCAPVKYQELDNAKSRGWNRENTTPAERQAERGAAKAGIPCAICGKMFKPSHGRKTCSEECRGKLQKQTTAAAEKRNKEARRKYHYDLQQAKLAAMTPEELRAYREKVNARARENYKKRKERSQ